MGIETAIAAGGLALSAYGMNKQDKAMKEQLRQSERVIEQQRNIEGQRQRQMELDATRRRREIVRQTLAAQSASIATMTAQGATGGGSSAPGGAYASIENRGRVNELGVNQNLEIGRNIFAANNTIFDAYRSSAVAGREAAMGGAFSQIGLGIAKNAGVITRVGETVFGGSRPTYYMQGNYRVPMYGR